MIHAHTHSDWQPSESQIAALDMSYLEAGSGPDVLLLHGWAAFKEIWWGTLRAIEMRYHGVALEWPGHGSSAPRADIVELSHLADLAAQSATALGLRDLTVVGHSMGGRVAALLAINYPDLVSRLVLVDAALNPAYLAPYARQLRKLRAVRQSVLLSRVLGRGVWALRPAPHDHPGGLVRPYLRRAYYNGMADPVVLHRYIDALYADSLEPQLSEIRQPTLVVSGARDPLVLPVQARKAAELIPNAELRLIRGALHNPMDDRPAAFYRVLLEFLDAQHAPAG